MNYTHTQVGTGSLLGSALGAFVLVFAVYILRTTGRGANWPRTRIVGGFTIASVCLVFLAIAFSRMTTTVDSTSLSWSFGFGLFGQRVPLSQIATAAVVQTTLDDGWGIHNTPNGKLYNVAGGQAVHVKLRDNTTFLIGTDQPEQLRQAIVGAAQLAPRDHASGLVNQ